MAAKSALFGAAAAFAALPSRHVNPAGAVRSSWAPTSYVAPVRLALEARPGVVWAVREEAAGDRGRYRNEDELVLRSEESDDESDQVEEEEEEEEEEEDEEEMMVGEEEVAEELEGLEEEAMTSGDEGREPSDYDRRAHIFDQSSRVFRALKERHDRSQQQ